MSKRTEYVCDRCGKDAPRGITLLSGQGWSEPVAMTGSIKYPLYGMGNEPPDFRPRDLCEACLQKLDAWLLEMQEHA